MSKLNSPIFNGPIFNGPIFNRQKFITFEGADGVGKSTLVSKVTAWLKENKFDFINTREPGGTDVAEEVRDTILKPGRQMSAITELFLYEAARADHVEKLITPALKAGKVVICDRFIHSSLAYQWHARGLDEQLVRTLNELATKGLNPDAVIWLKLDPGAAKQRMLIREQMGEQIDDRTSDPISKPMTRLDQENHDFHCKVFEAFVQISQDEKERFIVLDASKKPDEMVEDLLNNPLWLKLFKQ